eukprot:447364-Amphidinium_carterae.2
MGGAEALSPRFCLPWWARVEPAPSPGKLCPPLPCRYPWGVPAHACGFAGKKVLGVPFQRDPQGGGQTLPGAPEGSPHRLQKKSNVGSFQGSEELWNQPIDYEAFTVFRSLRREV